jgi:hypothetical protein
MIKRMDANTIATLATKEEMRADREQRKTKMEDMLAKMEGRMTSTKTNTGGNLRSLQRQMKKT